MLLYGGREPTVARPCKAQGALIISVSVWCFTSDWSREQEGGKSLIKQIISCWDESSSISEPPPRMLEALLNFHVLVAQFPLHRLTVCRLCGRAQSHRHHPLTCQDVHAFGGFLLRFYSSNSHEVLLLLVSLICYEILFIFVLFCRFILVS